MLTERSCNSVYIVRLAVVCAGLGVNLGYLTKKCGPFTLAMIAESVMAGGVDRSLSFTDQDWNTHNLRPFSRASQLVQMPEWLIEGVAAVKTAEGGEFGPVDLCDIHPSKWWTGLREVLDGPIFKQLRASNDNDQEMFDFISTMETHTAQPGAKAVAQAVFEAMQKQRAAMEFVSQPAETSSAQAAKEFISQSVKPGTDDMVEKLAETLRAAGANVKVVKVNSVEEIAARLLEERNKEIAAEEAKDPGAIRH